LGVSSANYNYNDFEAAIPEEGDVLNNNVFDV